MSEHDVQRTGPPQSQTQGTISPAPMPDEPSGIEQVSIQAEKAQKLVDDAVEGIISCQELAESLRDVGITAGQAEDYVDEYNQRIELRKAKSRRPNSLSPQPDQQQPDNDTERTHAIEEAAWIRLRSKLAKATPVRPENISRIPFNVDQVVKFLESAMGPPSPAGLSKEVLAVAPHLAQSSTSTLINPYLEQTSKAKNVYMADKNFDRLIERGQQEILRDPISRPMWKLIIQDKYVDFEKLYATLDRG